MTSDGKSTPPREEHAEPVPPANEQAGELARAGGEAPAAEADAEPTDRECAGNQPFAQTEGEPGKREAGPEVIRRFVQVLPLGPGVYRMYDRTGNVLYVGKARSLKKRVASYTKMGGHTNRIALMISLTADMEFVTTRTETEALLLEANLIKQLKPRFNVILRDDKSFPYIHLRMDHEAPQILKHRGARKGKGHYFGPFASAGAVNRTLNTLQRVFLLRSCSDSVYDSRTRPCLLYQIKRCAAPCTGEISAEDYGELVDDAVRFLKGKTTKTQAALSAKMEAAAEALEFEQAAQLRDRIRALTYVQAHQGINPHTVEECDVIAAVETAGQVSIQVFFFRAGQNWGNRAYFPRHDKSDGIEAVLEAFIGQFYENKPVPGLILLSHPLPQQALLGEALGLKSNRKVSLHVPQRGEKRDLVEHALTNAKDALGRRLAESASQRKLLEGVRDLFDLEATPERIEVYDNSHIQGTDAVGGMIVAGPEGFLKTHYRKFNIKDDALSPGDDYGMMREVLSRRFTRLLKENPREETNAPKTEDHSVGDGVSTPAWPDLVLIDGGQGQLQATLDTLQEIGIEDLAVVAISKGRDRDARREVFHMPGRPTFRLEPRDPVLYYLQRLRDEAHRFAIGTHRAKRAKSMAENPLDAIPGVGAARKRALLNHFGSARAVARAALADLEAVDGVSAAMAQRIYDHFRDGA